MDIDKALNRVGGYRRWNVTVFLLLSISMFTPICFQGLLIVFIGWEPPHHCRPTNSTASLQTSSNPTNNRGQYPFKCSLYDNLTSNGTTTGCVNGWAYDDEGYYTIVQQWDLVCERNYLSEVSQTTFQLGYLLSLIFFSPLVDIFGRKPVHIYTHIGIAIVGVGIAFSVNYAMFVLLRVVMGVLLLANVNSGTTLLLELFDSTRRTVTGIGIEGGWVCCYLLLPLLGYFVTDWRVLQVVTSGMSIVWVVYFWILPESPLWLTAVGRFAEAETALRQIAKWNGVKLAPDTILLDRINLKETQCKSVNIKRIANQNKVSDLALDLEAHRQTISDCVTVIQTAANSTVLSKNADTQSIPLSALFSDRYLRLVVLLCNCLWFANCVVYYALILSTPSLAGNRFINFTLMGLLEIPAFLVAMYSAGRFGRRISTCVYHILAGVPLAIVAFVPGTTASGADLSSLVLTLIMLSKFGISASFSVIVLYTRELFPTRMRGTGSSVGQVFAVVGNIVAPFAAYAYKAELAWLPNVLFGMISIAVGLLTLLLPETAGKPLPQTLADLKELFRGENKNGFIKHRPTVLGTE